MGSNNSGTTNSVTNRLHISDQNLYSLYTQVLDLTGLPKEKLRTMRVKVGEHAGKRIDMYTLIIDPENLKTKPLLVFLHGYAASAVLYYNMYKSLSEKFTVIGVDHIGMGASSRPENFDPDTISHKACINYFLDYFEKWRQRFS